MEIVTLSTVEAWANKEWAHAGGRGPTPGTLNLCATVGVAPVIGAPAAPQSAVVRAADIRSGHAGVHGEHVMGFECPDHCQASPCSRLRLP